MPERMKRGRPLILAAVLLFWTLGAPPAEAEPALYRGGSIVTGRDNLPERKRGARDALAEVLARVTADPLVLDNPALGRVLDHASASAAFFRCIDRKEGVPISDEQGTRDRSYLLEVEFEEAAVD